MSMTRKEMELRIEELLTSEAQLIARIDRLTDMARALYFAWADARGEASDLMDFPRHMPGDERDLATAACALLGLEAEDWEDGDVDTTVVTEE